MNDRKEYLKQYRISHKDKYREYNAKYRKTHLTTYDKLKEENEHLEHNWNELKSWLEEIHVRWKNWYANDLDSHDRRYYEKEYNYKMSVYEDVLDKISELEEGGNNDC